MTTILEKSDEIFALSYPQNAYPVDLVPLWPLPSPHPGQSCLVGIRNDAVGLQHCFFFFRLEGGVFVVASSFKSSILKLHGHGNVHFSQHFSAPLLFSPHSRAGVFEISLIALKKTENGWLRNRRNRKIDKKALELRAAYGQRRHAS